MDLIPSPSVKIPWYNKAKHFWVMSTNFLFSKVCWQYRQCFAFTPKSNFPAHNLNFHWRRRFKSGIKSRLPFKIFSTLIRVVTKLQPPWWRDAPILWHLQSTQSPWTLPKHYNMRKQKKKVFGTKLHRNCVHYLHFSLDYLR